jgi:hypothetical protein
MDDQMNPPESPASSPPGWSGLVCAEDWQYLSSHLNEERLRDLRILLGECPRGFGAKLVAEIRPLLPGSRPGHALVLALARAVHDSEHDLDCPGEGGSTKEPS